MKKKTELRLAKKQLIGQKQLAARLAHRRGTIQEDVDSVNERFSLTQGEGPSSLDFSLDDLEIVRE
jgi:hypothetical protein